MTFFAAQAPGSISLTAPTITNRELPALELTMKTYKRAEYRKTFARTHPEYKIWNLMLQRCFNHNAPNYARYGGRGITICEGWRKSYKNFIVDMGPRPSPQHSIDRIDNNGNYESENCRWSLPKEQQRNMRSNRIMTFRGISLCVSEWAERLGVCPQTLFSRLRYGWSSERVITETVKLDKYHRERRTA
jgi:hypothetical protein